MDTTETSLIDWETLADIIAEGKCVLFLGPEATINYTDKDRQTNFFLDLQKSSSGIHSYHKEDGLFVFSREGAILEAQLKLKKFYDNDFSSDMLTRLAQIPFHFVVMLTADTAFEKEMAKQGFAYNEDYYDTGVERSPEMPTTVTPLIYHLLGISNQTSSLIVSHGKMYQYIKAVLGGVKLPQNIKTAMNFENANNLIFLGLKFDKWYFQLILNMLGVDEKDYNSFASIQDGDNPLQTIWEEHFHINFVPHHIDTFVNKLHEAFVKRNGLRKASPSKQAKRDYNLANLKKFLTIAFSGEELDSFCLSYFPTVKDDFTPEQGKSTRITALLEYVRQHNEFDSLLGLMKDENAIQFEKNGPYYEEQ